MSPFKNKTIKAYAIITYEYRVVIHYKTYHRRARVNHEKGLTRLATTKKRGDSHRAKSRVRRNEEKIKLLIND